MAVLELGQITANTPFDWVAKYEQREDIYYCKQCGSRIKQTICYVSIHATEFEPVHAGSGRVIRVNFPYCPECDGKLDYVTACLHVPLKRTVKIDVPLINQ